VIDDVGMDHPHHPYSPLPGRPALRWPGGRPVAVVPVVLLEHYDDEPDWPQAAWLTGGVGIRTAPNIARWSHREYGLRVGVFRVLDALRRYGFGLTVAVDAKVARTRPWLVEHVMAGGAEVLGHGVAATRMIHDGLPADAEDDYVAGCLAELARHGVRPDGWLGPEYGESRRTPAVLARHGLRYVCDWCNDEQPYRMTVPDGDLVALPLMADLDDQFALATRGIRLASYGRMLTDAFDRLAVDGRGSARVLAWAVRPFITGQPFRIGVFEQALAHVADSGAAWTPTAGEVVGAWRASAQDTSRPHRPEGAVA
jgi:peptidoglycan/xylan/chitin deacetylase (PgdA/CDA1 family)